MFKKTTLIIFIYFSYNILYSQNIFHSIATDNGLITEGIIIENDKIHKDSNYIIFKNGSYSCNQYVHYYIIASKLAKQINAKLVILFDDNGEDAISYIDKYYNDSTIRFEAIVDGRMYQQMQINDNSFSVGFVQNNMLYKNINVVLLNNIRVADKLLDSVEIQKSFSNFSDLLLLNDTQVLVTDPSINQKITILSLNTGKETTKLYLNKNFWLADSIYRYLIKNKLTDYTIANYNEGVKINNKNNLTFAKDSEFEVNSFFKPIWYNTKIYLPVLYYYYPDSKDKNFTLSFLLILRLDINLNILDYYFFDREIYSFEHSWGIGGFSKVSNDTLCFEAEYTGSKVFDTPDYLQRTFSYFKVNETNHKLEFISLSSFRLPKYKLKTLNGAVCRPQMNILQNEKILIQDMPYLYNINSGNVVDTISDKYRYLDSLLNSKACFTSLEYYPVPTDTNYSYSIYKLEKENYQCDIVKHSNQKISLVFHTITPKKILGFYNNILYFYAEKYIDGKNKRFLYKMKIPNI